MTGRWRLLPLGVVPSCPRDSFHATGPAMDITITARGKTSVPSIGLRQVGVDRRACNAPVPVLATGPRPAGISRAAWAARMRGGVALRRRARRALRRGRILAVPAIRVRTYLPSLTAGGGRHYHLQIPQGDQWATR